MKLLFVTTSTSTMGSSGVPTGYWRDELYVPFATLTAAGHFVDVASPAGGEPPVDPNSVEGLVTSPALEEALAGSRALAEVDGAGYDGIFLVGGHGTMWDFPQDLDLVRLVETVGESGVVAAVCHGVAGLLTAQRAGRPIVADRRVAAFTDAEERLVGAEAVVPFSLEQRLVELGAKVDLADPFTAHAVRDDRLVTGQNPQSSEATAELMLEALADA